MKKPSKKEQCIVAALIFSVIGNILEAVFKYCALANNSAYILILFGSTLCNMLFVFAVTFYIVLAVCSITGLDLKAVPAVGFAAACLLPLPTLMEHNDRPVLPIHALWLELSDAMSKPTDLSVQNAYIAVVQHSYRGKKSVRTFFEYEYNGKKYRVPATKEFLSLARDVGMDNYEKADNIQIDEYAFLHWQEEYAEYWRKFKEEDPEEWERMKKSQEELNEKMKRENNK